MVPISLNCTSCPQLHVQDRRSRRTTVALIKGQSVSKNYFSLCKNIVHLLRLFNLCLLLKWKNWCLRKISAFNLCLHTIYCERFEPRSHFKRLSLIVQVNVVLNRTVFVDSDCHCQQQQSYSGLRSPEWSNSTYFW